MNGCQDITLIFQPQEKHMYLGIGDAKELFKTAIALWMIDKGIPFSMVEEKIFRKIHEVVMRHGRLAEQATQIEMEGQEVAWTTDH
jgi:hypothetical protein